MPANSRWDLIRGLKCRGLCDELITRAEELYRLRCVVVCDLETSRMGAPYIYIYIYIYDISHLRVKLKLITWPMDACWPYTKVSMRQPSYCTAKFVCESVTGFVWLWIESNGRVFFIYLFMIYLITLSVLWLQSVECFLRLLVHSELGKARSESVSWKDWAKSQNRSICVASCWLRQGWVGGTGGHGG